MVRPGLEDRIATTGATGGLNESTGKVPWGVSRERGSWLQRQAVTCQGDDVCLDVKSTAIQ